MSKISSNEDDELWRGASQGDTNAEEKLILKYSRLVRICARPYFLAGGDSEDLIQEGMMGLLSAIRQYDPNKDVLFKTFAEFCIRRRLYSAIKSASRNKHTPLNDYVSIQSPQFDENTAPASYYLRATEEFVIARERFDEIADCLSGSLSRFESKILGLYLEGMSYEEIAVRVSRSPKSVDNAVQRIRRKLARFKNSGDYQRKAERK